MPVTIVGNIQNAGEDEQTGSLRITASKDFFDRDKDYHISTIPYIETISDGSFSISLAATLDLSYVQSSYTDDGNIIVVTSVPLGSLGNNITIKIEDGTNASTSKITLVYDSTTYQYDNINMDETVPSTYIVDVLNASGVVTCVRLSLDSVDTLPTNVDTTNLASGTTTNAIKYQGNNYVTYKFEFLDQYCKVYRMIDKIQVSYTSSEVDFVDLLP